MKEAAVAIWQSVTEPLGSKGPFPSDVTASLNYLPSLPLEMGTGVVDPTDHESPPKNRFCWASKKKKLLRLSRRAVKLCFLLQLH